MIPEALKDIPGYKAILKAVLRQQIQQLVEQLSEQTGEETVVLSANISDGTLSHLGSEYGKVFLQEEQTIKSKFLGFCLKRNLNNQSESSQDTDGREWSVPQLKRKTSNSIISAGSSAKVPKLSDSEFSNAGISHNQLNSDIMKCLPDLSRATSNYMLKLNQTVGQEVMKDSDSDVTNQYQIELPSNMAAESDIDFNRHDRTDIDLSIVKIEKQSESNEKENRKSDSRFNKFGASPNLPQFEAYSGSWTKNPMAGGSNPELSSLSNHSTGLWGNSHNSLNIQGGQFTNSDWPELNTVNNNLLIQRKEYKCEFCDKVFREKTNLRVHVRTHTGEKPFRCLLCGKEFAHSSNLKQHERGVHKLPPTVPQYKQQFYTGLTKMYGMTNVKPSESSNTLSENQPLLSGYQNIQSFQQNQNNEDIKSLQNSIEFDSENENKDNVFSQSQAVFPTNGDRGFVNRIKVECEDTNDSVIDDTGTPSQFSRKSTDNENETSEDLVENLL